MPPGMPGLPGTSDSLGTAKGTGGASASCACACAGARKTIAAATLTASRLLMPPRSITDVLASRFAMSARLVASVVASSLFLGTVAPAFADDAKPASGKIETLDERDARQRARMDGWIAIG